MTKQSTPDRTAEPMYVAVYECLQKHPVYISPENLWPIDAKCRDLMSEISARFATMGIPVVDRYSAGDSPTIIRFSKLIHVSGNRVIASLDVSYQNKVGFHYTNVVFRAIDRLIDEVALRMCSLVIDDVNPHVPLKNSGGKANVLAPHPPETPPSDGLRHF
jgi:hypothetical protein